MVRIKKSVIILVLAILIAALGAVEYRLLSAKKPPPATTTGMTGMENHHAPPSSAVGQPLISVGSVAPEFELDSLSGRTIRLVDYRGKRVILFFNEGSMCYPSCWSQMSTLLKDQRLSSAASIFSIVVDTKEQWEEIVEKVPSMKSVDLLLDTDRSVSRAYGMLFAESSMHKGSYPGHTYIIIDEKGIVRYVLDDPAMAINNDRLAQALSALGE